MAEAQPIKFGPFTAGMNTYSDPTAIAESEAAYIQNFDIDIDGSLVSRPPISIHDTDASFTASRMLGIYSMADGTDYVIYSKAGGTYAFKFSDKTNTLITNSIQAAACVQYDNKVFLVAPVGSANPGGSWDGTTFTAVATMPKGNSACIYKERMFVGQGANGASTLYFSSAADPGAAWDPADFLYVNKGDGESLNDVRVFNNVVVIFKESSTYIFAYDSAPTRGTVQLVSATVGVKAQGCVVDYENSMYVLHDNKVYQVQNWNFDPVNIKVPFVYQNVTPAAMATPEGLSLLRDRLYVRYFDKSYIYNLKTRGWSEWVSTFKPALWFKDPTLNTLTGVEQYVSVSALNDQDDCYVFNDGYVQGITENMTCSLITKTHAMEVPYTFKRLMWWGVDGLFMSELQAKVSPISYARIVTWAQVAQHSWDDLGTWVRLLDTSLDVTDQASFSSANETRTFVKFIKSLRFRQLYFTLSIDTTGDPTTGPARIFFIMAVTANKQVVNRKAN